MIGFFLVLLSLISHWVWTTNFSVLTSGDWIYQDPTMLQEFWAIPSIWSATGLGTINIGISFTPFQLLYSLLSYAGLGYGISERIVFLWPILIALPLGSYLLIKKNVNNILAASIGSLVYSYNSYFLLIENGHLTLLAAFAFIPFVLLFYQKALQEKKIFYALIATFFGFIVSFYEFRAFYLLCFLLFFYAAFSIFIIEKKKNIKKFLQLSFFAAFPIGSILLLNAYWLIALANTGTLASNVAFDRSLFGNEYLNILHAFSLHHPFWTGSKTAIFEVQAIPLYFWFIPLIAFAGLYFNRNNKDVLFFGFIALLGIFLTKQVGYPFNDSYEWLYHHFPGFNAFREASKFYFFIVLGYSVLIASFVAWMFTSWKGVTKHAKYVFTFFIALLFLWNLKPIITTEMRTLFIPRQIPADYVKVKEFILSQDAYSRTLWLPTYSRWSPFTNNHPEVSGIVTLNAEWNKHIQDKRTDKSVEAELLMQLLEMPLADRLLDASAIKYVIVPLEDKQNEDNFIVDYQKPRNFYLAALDKAPYLERIKIGTKEILIYENKNVKPHIYLSSEKNSLEKAYSEKTVSFEQVSPTEYVIDLNNLTKPTYLHFAENYHPDWKIQITSGEWLSESEHFQTDAGLNSFRIDPQSVCPNKNACTLVLTFKPQSYVYIGSIISIMTAISLMTLFVYLVIRRKKHGR